MARKCEHAAKREIPLPRVMGASQIACVLRAFPLQRFFETFATVKNSILSLPPLCEVHKMCSLTQSYSRDLLQNFIWKSATLLRGLLINIWEMLVWPS